MINANNSKIVEIEKKDADEYVEKSGFTPISEYGDKIDLVEGEIGAFVYHHYDAVLNKETGLFEGTVEIKDRIIVKE